jgi:ribosome recycling factor
MIEDVLADSENRMRKAVEAVERELAAIRTGHAHVGLVDHVMVEYFGSTLPMNQMGTVSAPEARLLTIQPWDRNAMSAIEKAIQKSDLGLTPSNDGQVIRLAIPPLTEQRRKDLIKVVHSRVEDGRVAVRNVRRDGMDNLKADENKKEISEDERKRAETEVQKLTDSTIAELDAAAAAKEKEILG